MHETLIYEACTEEILTIGTLIGDTRPIETLIDKTLAIGKRENIPETENSLSWTKVHQGRVNRWTGQFP